ncbi:MAG TPA: hypothetical protein VG317_14405 [Pseudonocardiaceae bacterium]|jgi:hypothetical protein|nr:hypothetical protein [Pseudonocardiaceae bacterium]
MICWDRHSDRLVVGIFQAEEIATLRARITELRELALTRLGSCQLVAPFGASTALYATEAPPDDPRLQMLLANFFGPSAEGVWALIETELWWEIVDSADLALGLLPETGGRVELSCANDQHRLMIGLLQALRVVADSHPDGRDAAYSGWLNEVVQSLWWLVKLPTEPTTDPRRELAS